MRLITRSLIQLLVTELRLKMPFCPTLQPSHPVDFSHFHYLVLFQERKQGGRGVAKEVRTLLLIACLSLCLRAMNPQPRIKEKG